jgi:hypothetical protein
MQRRCENKTDPNLGTKPRNTKDESNPPISIEHCNRENVLANSAKAIV